MGAFNINITGVGGHGCERKAKAGDKLWGAAADSAVPIAPRSISLSG